MPFNMQISNIYRSRAIGSWLQENNIKVIPNVRFGDYRTFDICCDGLAKNAVISVGSHGTLSNKTDREIFKSGLYHIVEKIKPSEIIVYGYAPKDIFQQLIDLGIIIYTFDSDFNRSRKKKKEVI